MKLNISASMVKDYLSCLRKPYYRIFYPESSIQTEPLIVGDIIHKVIEKCWNKDKKEALEYAKTLLRNSNLFDDPKDAVKKISISLNNFYGNFVYLVSDGDQLEKYFKYKYSGEVSLVGKIDLITKDGILIDWKSGYKVPKNINNDVQFIMYYNYYIREYNKVPSKVLLINLITNKIIKFEPVDYYMRTLYDDLIPKMIDDITNKRFVRTGFYNNACLDCQFQSTCWREI